MRPMVSMALAPLAGGLFVLLVTRGLAAGRLERARAEPELRFPSLEARYLQWRADFVAGGGDRRARIALGPIRGLSPPAPRATGAIELDLLDGVVSVRVDHLDGPADLWLVDNRAGASVLPEAGDATLRVGRLERGRAELEVRLGADAFSDFEVDLAVVTPADSGAEAPPLLAGARSGFERRYSRERRGRVLPAVSAAGDEDGGDPRVLLGLVSPLVLAGGELFFRESFDGNGRSCGTCHPAANDLVIDPAFVQPLHRARPNDPLFVADPGRPGGVPALEVPALLDEFALVRENVDGFEAPTEKFVMRGVPHTLSLATSLDPPEADGQGDLPDGTTPDFRQRTGWSGDGVFAPGLLRLFPVGAVIQHYTRDVDLREPGPDSFRLPDDDELDAMEAFMLSTGRTADLDLAAVSLRDPGAERGRVLFTAGVGGAKCFGCHQNAGANSPFGGNRNFDTGIERVRLLRLDDFDVPGDGGFGGQGLPDPDFDSDGDGVADAFGTGSFNTPPLVEAADTAPFFHTNAFADLEEAVAFYSSADFARSPGGGLVASVFGEGIELEEGETRDVAAFLRVVNAAFNLSLAIQRIEAAQSIDARFGRRETELSNGLLRLANEELRDARRVLGERSLHRSVRLRIRGAIAANRIALRSRHPLVRGFYAAVADGWSGAARRSLGSGLEFDLGEGNLVF